MSREFRDSEYVDDDGLPWLLRVRAEYALDPNRGPWVAAPRGTPPFPRLRFPRRVFGVDATGRVLHAVIASVDAPLWTGAVHTFEVVANDGSLVIATVTGRQGEKRFR